jgi:hypothetical protein
MVSIRPFQKLTPSIAVFEVIHVVAKIASDLIAFLIDRVNILVRSRQC